MKFDPIVLGCIYAFLICVLLLSRMWISTVLALVGILGLYFVSGGNAIAMIGDLLFNTTNHFTYTMMPLFILLGEFIKYSGISDKLYTGASHWVKRIPGGLLHSNIASCALFAAVSGSSMATAATIGAVAIPEMEKRQYDKKLIYGSLAAGGTLGILIPPSLQFIIYGSLVGDSIGRLFIAGVIPGILMALTFMLYIFIRAVIQPDIAPKLERSSFKEKLLSIKDIFPTAILIFTVIGTIYMGIATPTEAGALGASLSALLVIAYGKMSWKVLKNSLISSMEITLFLMVIVLGAYILSMAFSMERIPAIVAKMVSELNVNRYVIWGILVVMYLIMGCFIDGISMVLLTVPVVHPVMMALGFDSIWLGVVLTVCVEMGQVTPPVGVNLFVIHGLVGGAFREIILGSLPFVLIQLFLLVILTIFPALATWLPNQLHTQF